MISPISAGGGFTRTGICTLVDMESLEIDVDVNESYINRVKPGQHVEAMLDAYPDWQIPAHGHHHHPHGRPPEGDGQGAHRLRPARPAHPARHGGQGRVPRRGRGDRGAGRPGDRRPLAPRRGCRAPRCARTTASGRRSWCAATASSGAPCGRRGAGRRGGGDRRADAGRAGGDRRTAGPGGRPQGGRAERRRRAAGESRTESGTSEAAAGKYGRGSMRPARMSTWTSGSRTATASRGRRTECATGDGEPAQTLVRVRDVHKFYQRGAERIDVLNGLNLDIPQGDFLALMGPSGSGKTTLLNLIGGLDRPSSGAVEVGGERDRPPRPTASWRAGGRATSASSSSSTTCCRC